MANLTSVLDDAEKALNNGDPGAAVSHVHNYAALVDGMNPQPFTLNKRANGIEKRALERLQNRDICTRVIKFDPLPEG